MNRYKYYFDEKRLNDNGNIEAHKIINEDIEMEKKYKSYFSESGFSYQMINHSEHKAEIRSLISKISQTINYDMDMARSVCVHILEDVNDHAMSAKLDSMFSKSM